MQDRPSPQAGSGLKVWIPVLLVFALALLLFSTPFWSGTNRQNPGTIDSTRSVGSGGSSTSNPLSRQIVALEGRPKPGLVLKARSGEREIVEIVEIVPLPAFALNANESLHPALEPSFTATWSGALRLEEGGSYRFDAGDAKLWIGDHEVPPEGFRLPAGWVPLRLEASRTDASFARQQLRWRGPGFPWEPIPERFLGHYEDEASAAQLTLARGQRSFADYGCAQCHESGADAMHARRAPDLGRVGARANAQWIASWLEDPHAFRRDAAMPVTPLSERDRMDLAAYLSKLGAPPKADEGAAPEGRLERGKELYAGFGCGACHTPDHLALHGMGSKTTVAALTDYLLDPLAVDPSGRMPAFFGGPGSDATREREDARAIATYLVHSAKLGNRQWPAPSAIEGDGARAETLLQERGCLSCHPISADPVDRARALSSDGPAAAGERLGAWQVVGPFTSIDNDFLRELPPESNRALDARYPDGQGGELSWKPAPQYTDGKIHTLAPKLDHAAMFLQREIRADEPMLLRIDARCDDLFTLWIDERKIGEVLKNSIGGAQLFEVMLQPGTHRLFWKVGDNSGQWRIQFQAEMLTGAVAIPLEDRSSAPPLESLNAEAGCLADAPAAPAPLFRFAAGERDALRAWLAARVPIEEATPAPAYHARRAIEHLSCQRCHTARGAPLAPGLEDAPPPIELAGKKLRQSALEKILFERKRARGWLQVRMPHFGTEALAHLPRGLAAERGIEAGEGAAPPEVTLADRAAGVDLLGVGVTRFACTSCHDYKDTVALGERGPDLAGMHDRIRFEWFERWLREPARERPGTSMPAFLLNLDPATSEQVVRELWAGLSFGSKLPPPPGLGANQDATGERPPTVRPLLYRCYLPDATPSSFAVALPGLVSYVWDPSQCRLRYAWIGDFLDMAPQWRYKGETFPTILGEIFVRTTEGRGLILVGAEAERRFGGYRLEQGLPTFLWSQGAASVEVRPQAVENGTALMLLYRVTDAPGAVRWIRPDAPDAAFTALGGSFDGDVLERVPADLHEFAVTIRPLEGR